jgi:predicted RNA binding protein YcfA (HicA-like mRNA interferase family)
MTKLPLCGAQCLIRMLQNHGFTVIRTKGSHHVLRHADGRTTIVPLHQGKDIPRPLLHEILHQAGFSRDEYLAWMAKR